MEIIIIAAVVIGGVGWWIWKEGKHEESGKHPLDGATKAPEPWPFPTSRPPEGADKTTSVLDVNKDGKVDLADAKAAVLEVKETLVVAADVNKDGKVDVEDAKVVVKAAKEKTQKAAKKAKAKVEEVVEKVKKPKKSKK